MANVDGTITGISLVSAPVNGVGARKAYLVTCNFATYTGSSDTARVLSVDTAIQNAVKNGKTFTVRAAMSGGAGADTNGQAVYTSATITNTSGTLSFDLCTTTTELTGSTASTGVPIVVVGDES